MFDFPNAPSNGQIAIGPGGISYTWDNTKWVATSAGGVAYAPINSPSFTGDPQTPTAAITDADNSIASTAFVQAVAAPSANNAGRNLIHNGTFVVAQRGAGPWTVNGYTLDRWWMHGTSDTFSITQNFAADAGRAQVGDEAFTSYFNNAFVGNAAAGAFNVVTQPVENVRRLGGKTITVSFWAVGNTGTPKLGVSIDQTFGSGGSPSVDVNGNGTAVTLSTTWARYSVMFSIPGTSGKTLGTAGDHATYLNFWFSSGATNATRSGSVGVQSNTISVWGVQLEIGSVATKLDQGGSPQQVLAECQRFYNVISPVTLICPVATSLNGFTANIVYPVAMRATPTLAATHVAGSVTRGATFAYQGPAGATVYMAGSGVAGDYEVHSVTASADL